MTDARNLRFSWCFLASLALSAGCGDAGGDPGPDRPCTVITQCESNRVCRVTAPNTTGRCVVPDGRCASASTAAQDCYPEARCVFSSPSSDAGVSGGQCTFAPPARQGFSVSEQIALQRPANNHLAPVIQDVSFQWEPPVSARGVQSTTVAVIMDTLPVLTTTRQIANRTHIKWIWSSSDPGGPVQDGTVPFHFGRRGVSASGELGPAWDRDSLSPGTYVWFVYAIAQGQVVAASEVRRFSVSIPSMLPATCAANTDCVLLDDLPEMVECVSRRCRRRCASDVDCAVYGGTCDFSVNTGNRARHGAFCALPSGVPFGS